MKLTGPLIAFLLAGCSGGTSTPTAEPTPAALVALAPAQAGSLDRTVTIYGVAESSASSGQALSSPTDAIVSELRVSVGAAVSRGQVIARLSPAPTVRLDLAKASADARAADAALARAKRLRADGLVSDAEVERARAAAASADATRASLSSQTGSLTLRAPVAGFVATIAVSPGDRLTAGAPVATITRGGALRGRFGADPQVARALQPGQRIQVTTSTGTAPFAAPIVSITPVADPQTRLASIFTTLPSQAGVAAGESLSGEVVVASSGNALTIPYDALLDDGGRPYVFTVSGGVAHRQDVVIGPVSNGRVAITKGLAPRAQVVVKGGTALDDGVKVRTR